MAIGPGSILVGRCYLTHSNTVRRLLEVDVQTVTYVARGKMAFTSWDKGSWHSTSKEKFVSEISHEVPCDWRGE
jgi:hypothetical protein